MAIKLTFHEMKEGRDDKSAKMTVTRSCLMQL